MHYPDIANHARLVQAVVRGNTRGLEVPENHITQSWRRCVEDHGLHPADRREPVVLERGELLQRQERCDRLLDIARTEMTSLYQQVAGSGYAILLTDRDGVVLNFVGDPLFTEAAARSGMHAGAVWSEAAQGTNGMGTCLVEQRPLVIHHREHFLAHHTGLTCSAAPIFDPHGEMLAVLDASSESSLAQQHTMVLVNMSAQMIENRVFLCAMKSSYIARFHSRPEFVSTLGEGAIAFEPDGRILAANRSALFQLDLVSQADIVGRPLQEVFNLSLPQALQRAEHHTFQPLPIREARGGRRYFAVFQPPENQAPAPFAAAARGRRAAPAVAAVTDEPGDPLAALEFGDARMRRNIERARRLSDRDIPLLLMGETGTGKDMFAKAVHQAGRRGHKPFVAVNCASLPETLIESELFGYRPGAFTGASREGSRGKILQADGGTLFLDEIGDMPLHLQARLLRVLEEREVFPLGGETAVAVDIRLISATHRDLKQQVAEGRFRQDLYYRLHGITLTLPPLRERGDRRALIEALARAESGGRELHFDTEALARLDAYAWPGNIRQLRNVMRTVVGLAESDNITVHDLPDELLELPLAAAGDGSGQQPENALAAAERDAILREMEALHWNVTRVAARLNLSRNTLYRKMKRYGIRPPR
ncbi:sigma-54-dependent Fis family transcriptional regulator [Thioalbus denitrificans]|uniref:Transcriptional regulator of acetoin/glycerol metabolism n=1 Tax=Thioalbus denitrificans TaxID=547122 RepID=A0A369C867_9GAMM|nr:sigma-54-dependent Fis family transcriptional regulator [Thioalbus denitrificans]RCX30200.1 transcriptional regulator of acetoin/glycerol metabolism [Thioalbus denitrificans]